MLSSPGAFDVTQVKHLDRLFINVQRRVQQTATGLTTANRNMPYLLTMELLDTLRKYYSREGHQHHIIPLYSSNMNSRVTFLSSNTGSSSSSDIPVRHTLTLHLFRSRDLPLGSFHTGLLILEADPADSGAFYTEIDVLTSNMHTDLVIYIADLPMGARFASTQLEEDLCVRSMLGQVSGVTALEGHEKLSVKELYESFKDIAEDSISDILSGLLERESSNGTTRTHVSFLLIYVPVTDAILDECYLADMAPRLHKLSEALVLRT